MLRLVAVTAGAALLSACGPGSAGSGASAASTPVPTSPPTPAAAGTPPVAAAVAAPTVVPTSGQPRTGGTLRVAATADVASLDGHARSGAGYDTIWSIYDRLTQYDASAKPQPMLAESWETTPDFKQIKFNLRKGVQWHSGREFVSDDVKWNLLRVRDPKVASGAYVNWSNWFTSIELPDKYTVVLTSDQPRPTMFDFFEWLNMLDPITTDGPDAKVKAIGTGPFTFLEWKQGESMTFARNTNYWQPGRPYVDGFVTYIRDPQASIAQLEAGAVDMVKSDSIEDIIRLRQDPNYQVVQHPFPGTYYAVGFNVTRPPFDNKLVRQALNLAIDRQRFTSAIMHDIVKPIALPWSTNNPAYDAARNASMMFDLNSAQTLLKQASVDSLELDLLYIPSAYPVLMPWVQIYQNDLAQIGVKLNVQGLTVGPWNDQVNNQQYNGMYVGGDSLGNLAPATPLGAAPTFSAAKNNSGFKTERWTQLVDSVGIEADPARQQQLYTQINDYLLDQVFALPIAERPVIWLTRSKVKTIAPIGRQMFQMPDTWLDG
jgi:peptide/nickel transport system substrate-binding protein